jgi:hypothetical protein
MRMLRRLVLIAIPYGARALFSPRSAPDLEATFELRISDPRGGEPARFALVIGGGRCQVRRGAVVDAAAAVTVAAADLVRMVLRVVGWPELLAKGRLELSGNPFLALRFPTAFRLPAAASPRLARTPSWARSPRTRRSSGSATTS